MAFFMKGHGIRRAAACLLGAGVLGLGWGLAPAGLEHGWGPAVAQAAPAGPYDLQIVKVEPNGTKAGQLLSIKVTVKNAGPSDSLHAFVNATVYDMSGKKIHGFTDGVSVLKPGETEVLYLRDRNREDRAPKGKHVIKSYLTGNGAKQDANHGNNQKETAVTYQ